MPFKIKQNDSRCESSKPWAVVNSDTDKLHGCHPTKSKAEDQLAALYANVPDADQDSAHHIDFGLGVLTWPFTDETPI